MLVIWIDYLRSYLYSKKKKRNREPINLKLDKNLCELIKQLCIEPSLNALLKNFKQNKNLRLFFKVNKFEYNLKNRQYKVF